MTHFTNENEEKRQAQNSAGSGKEGQKILGKVFNGFVPDFWKQIKRNPEYDELFITIYSLDGVRWELGASAESMIEEMHRLDYHVIVLDPKFNLQPFTDPIPVRSLNDPC